MPLMPSLFLLLSFCGNPAGYILKDGHRRRFSPHFCSGPLFIGKEEMLD
jgi:hypothetical protein